MLIGSLILKDTTCISYKNKIASLSDITPEFNLLLTTVKYSGPVHDLQYK